MGKDNMDEDIRWKQRFQNYKKALTTLKSAVELAANRELKKKKKQGTIQGFEFTFELAWNVMKDYLDKRYLLCSACKTRGKDKQPGIRGKSL
jgi:hypothetical protein